MTDGVVSEVDTATDPAYKAGTLEKALYLDQQLGVLERLASSRGSRPVQGARSVPGSLSKEEIETQKSLQQSLLSILKITTPPKNIDKDAVSWATPASIDHNAIFSPTCSFQVPLAIIVAMSEFTAYCPKCNSESVKLLGMHSNQDLNASVFAYRCLCGLSFILEISQGKQPVCKIAGFRESPASYSNLIHGSWFLSVQ
jgi:hypothetical protein